MTSYFWDDLRIYASVFFAVIAIVAGCMIGARYWMHDLEEGECGTYSIHTGRDTHFVNYSWWTWDCLTPSSDGRWIPVGNLREVTSE